MSQQVQAQAQVQAQVQAQAHRLDNKSTHVLAIKAPYTIFAKKLGEGHYSWVAYSLGRPQNMIWGLATQRNAGVAGARRAMKVEVEYGCSYGTRKVINDMLDIRKKDGYVLISTLSKDRISHRILSHLLKISYGNGTGINYSDVVLSYEELDAKLMEICHEEDPEDLICGDTSRYIDILARRLQKTPNMVTRYAFPKEVTDAIVHFIEHNITLESNIPEVCHTLDQCNETPHNKTCDLYGEYYGLL